ncbi:MAG: heme A synthase [Micromonosporaceae bacterium]|nr:heme A synthase [Micromonosporaceae bacterium]
MTVVSVSSTLVRRLALASLLGNLAIVLTGGAVRLTDSGLGCPTWPRCSDESWTATTEMGIHGVIENGNRGLGVVLGAVALAGFLAALGLRPRRGSLVRLSGAVLAGVAAQGAIGGAAVWTDLNPWIVAGHFLISMALIAAAYAFWRRVDEPDAPVRPTVPSPLRPLTWLLGVVAAGLLVVGTVVTGSGPHAGDADVPRTGLDPQALTQAHADLAFLLLGLAVAGWFALRAARADPAATRAAAMLIGAILAQGAIGLVQYATGLPELVVWLHLLGASLIWLATVHLLHTTGTREPVQPSASIMELPERVARRVAP